MKKTVTYGIMHMSVAIIVAYILSRNWALATSIGIIEPLVQTGFYHLHEHLWKKSEKTEKNSNTRDSHAPQHILIHSCHIQRS